MEKVLGKFQTSDTIQGSTKAAKSGLQSSCPRAFLNSDKVCFISDDEQRSIEEQFRKFSSDNIRFLDASIEKNLYKNSVKINKDKEKWHNRHGMI